MTTKNPNAHDKARCQNRDKCIGPGCRVNSGKTARKRRGK